MLMQKKTASGAAALVVMVAFAGTTAGRASASSIIDYWPRETVYMAGPSGNYLAEWMGASAGWTTISGPVENIIGGSAGLFAIDPASGDILQYNGTPDSWTDIGGPGEVFVEGGGHLYGLGPGGAYVAEWNGTPHSWTIIGGSADYIYAGGAGLVATSPGRGYNGHVFLYNGTPDSWTDIGAIGQSFAVGPDAIYRWNLDWQSISQWQGGTTWTSIGTPAGQPVNIAAVGDEGLIIDEGSNGDELKYNGTPGSFTEIGSTVALGSPGVEVESLTTVYGVKYTDASETTFDVYAYSGSGTGWTEIGGPSSGVLAAEN